MNIVILGCGRVGARLAQLMEQDGYDVAIIDSDVNSLSRLPETFKGQRVLGTGIDVDVLKSAGIEKADAFAAVTNYDNTNIMACEVAKEIFGVKKVLARIYDPGREDLYYNLGLETICPTTLISTAARQILTGDRPSSATQESVPALQTGILPQVVEGRGGDAQSMSNDLSSSSAETSTQGSTIHSGASAPDGRVGDAHSEKTPHNGRGIRDLFHH